MSTYPGMNLRGEVRESVSLDEDDLSDVEDEVFIRDGKNGYKFQFEDVSVKKPLMAPRRKLGRSDFSRHIRNQPPCKAVCKLCCYAFLALTVLIGLIILVVVLVSLFPLPLDKLKFWFFNTTNEEKPVKLMPCSHLKVTDVWTSSFPKLISESSIQMVDVNNDGIDDVVFGFGTSDEDTLPPELFCSMFLGVSPPCQGGVIALNGSNGEILWRHWLPHSVFTLFCTVDVNFDNVTDCLISGKGGVFSILNGSNGTAIWTFDDKFKDSSLVIDVYWPNFIPDLDNDTVPDILASHTSQKGRLRLGHLIVISGKTGAELHRVPTPESVETYYIPQLLKQHDGNFSVLFGTGSPTSPGNLSLVPFNDLFIGNMTPQTLYQDFDKGVFSSAVLVDITGDTTPDIISAMFNSTVIAIDGSSLQPLWNFTIPNSQTLSVPIPAYFNNDNVTDFLVKYQTGTDFPTYYYSQTFIIDGKTGKSIYHSPIIDTVGSQMGGLTLRMEGYGFDFFLFWISDCKNFEGNQETFEFVPGSKIQQQTKADLCKLRFNSSMVVKLVALNQYEQPPGIEVYLSENRMTLEYNNSRNVIFEAKEYLKLHPEIPLRPLQSHTESSGTEDSNVGHDYDQVEPFRNIKYKDGSSFRHKSNDQSLIRDFSKNKPHKTVQSEISPKYDNDYDTQPPENWHNIAEDLDNDYNTYIDEGEPIYTKTLTSTNTRDPRSKAAIPENGKNDAEIKNSGIYGYKNVQKARTRLLHDLNDLPTDILRDTYFKNRERQLRKSRFEQRDIKTTHSKESEAIKKVIDEEKKASLNNSQTLWDLESEKENEDKESGYWRGKRQTNSSTPGNIYNFNGVPKITSIGAITSSLNATNNSIDLVFLTYWVSPKNGAQILLPQDAKCINDKLKKTIDNKVQLNAFKKASLEDLFQNQCLEERGINTKSALNNLNKEDAQSFPLLRQIKQLTVSQMTVYRIRLECVCDTVKKGEKCAKFLKAEDQNWSSYLGKLGDGYFKTRK